MEYAYQKKNGPRTARARIGSVNASYKDLIAVCSNVRGHETEGAIEFLKEAAEKKKAIYFGTYNSGKGHRRELGGRKGGWPVKSVKIVLGVLESALANATKLGLSQTTVAHIMANKRDSFPRLSPKGRRIRHNYETAFVEAVLEEISAPAKKEGKAGANKAAGAAPQKAAEKKSPSAQPAKAEAQKAAPMVAAKS